MKILFALLAAAAATAALPAAARAQLHSGDIILTVESNRIITNGVEAGSGTLIPGLRVFKATFGAVLPDFTSDPGFDCQPGTFPTPSQVGFDILDAVRIWNGATFDAVAAQTISIEFGPLGPAFSPPAAGTESPGFGVDVQSSGQWHRHFDYIIEGPGGAAVPNGLYLLQLRLWSTAGIADSDRVYLVFNKGMSADAHEAAAVWVSRAVAAPTRIGDLNFDGIINSTDVALLLGAWGTTALAPDLNHDGVVNSSDLAQVLGNWGG